MTRSLGLVGGARASGGRPALVAFAFGLSGAAALIYQVAWQRILAFQSGVGIGSIAMIVAAFMAGIGLGAYFGGRMSARVSASRALLIFAGIELCLGLFASLSCWFYYDILYTRYAGSYGASAALLQFVTLLPPTALMGMSLPFLVRATVRDSETAAHTISALYGINVLGAAINGGAEAHDDGVGVADLRHRRADAPLLDRARFLGNHLDAVRAQFEEDAQDVTWTSLIPEGTIPPIELNADKMEKFRPLLAEFEYDLESGKTYIEQLGIDYPTVREH